MLIQGLRGGVTFAVLLIAVASTPQLREARAEECGVTMFDKPPTLEEMKRALGGPCGQSQPGAARAEGQSRAKLAPAPVLQSPINETPAVTAQSHPNVPPAAVAQSATNEAPAATAQSRVNEARAEAQTGPNGAHPEACGLTMFDKPPTVEELKAALSAPCGQSSTQEARAKGQSPASDARAGGQSGTSEARAEDCGVTIFDTPPTAEELMKALSAPCGQKRTNEVAYQASATGSLQRKSAQRSNSKQPLRPAGPAAPNP